MRAFYTANLLTSFEATDSFTTEPYEAAWASEAIYFVRLEASSAADPTVQCRLQISPDGVSWLDEGTTLTVGELGDHFVRATHFGGWLRLFINVPSGQTRRLSVHLALKE